jgi:hypothetical protein
LAVAIDLMTAGWAVFRALSPACFCDLIATKDGVTRYLEVRTGHRGNHGKPVFSKYARPGATEFAVYLAASREVVYLPAKP